MIKRETGRFIQVIVLCVLVAGPLICLPVAAAPVAISGPTVITAPGNYILTRDIVSSSTVRCIEIRAPNVVFDGQGHLISGSGQSGTSGVYVASGLSSGPVTIRDVRVKNWDLGITISTTRASIERCTATENTQGITLRFAAGTRITGCTASNNTRMGLDLHDTTRAVLTRNTLTGNAAGVGLLTSPGATVYSNTITKNTWGVVAESSNNPVIKNNLFVLNGEAIVLSHSAGAVISGNRIIPPVGSGEGGAE